MKDGFSQDFISMLLTNNRSISDMPSCLAFPHGMHSKSSICLCCLFACHVQALCIFITICLFILLKPRLKGYFLFHLK